MMLSVRPDYPLDPLIVAIMREMDRLIRKVKLSYFVCGAIASTEAVEIALELETLGGSPIGMRGAIMLEPNGQKAAPLKEIPGFGSLPSSFQGLLRLSSQKPISAISARIQDTGHGDFEVVITLLRLRRPHCRG